MLLIVTLAFCLISYVLKINPFLAYFSYVCGLTIVKSFISDSLKDLFIISKSTKIYTKIGFTYSVISGSSLLILCLYYSIMECGRFSYQYLIPMILVNFLIYRFIFWDMSYKIHRKILNRKIGSDF
ncbi:Uncharacterised protein [Urinicoccus massiliensis]|uniref:Uncharacterized protein n=1 Tax=Urinicoccus massiliensis TaxID=1723382 RepID=A0A8H2QT59_9FIRM|nr:Uncharacterised protein [Urinicoccus massiliensis]